MNFTRLIYHFLGGVYFAIILIAFVTLFVIAGTFIESATQSHQYAALFTYENPLFAALLWGFFINIFFSATRRWPFKLKHIPFLTTHLGLLMILSGVLIKHYFGIQGSMLLSEGTASHQIFENNTYAVNVTKKNTLNAVHFPLRKTFGGRHISEIASNDDFSIRLIEYFPHCSENLTTWVKGGHATISGLKPMPLKMTDDLMLIPEGGRARFYPDGKVWDLYALKTNDIEKTLEKLYLQNARLLISHRKSNEIDIDIPLEKIFKHSAALKDGINISAELFLDFSTIEGFQNSQMKILIGDSDEMLIPLKGNKALLNLNIANPQFGYFPISATISRNPIIAVIEDEFEDVYLIAFDSHGQVWSKPFRKGNLDFLVAYDDGFAGYSAHAEIPFRAFNTGMKDRENALNHQLTLQLRQAVLDGAELSPPLNLLKKSCQKLQMDFPEITTSFLVQWNDSYCWLYPENTPLSPSLKKVFSNLNWKEVAPQTRQACEWTKHLFSQMELDLKKGFPLLSILRKNGWPLLADLENESLSAATNAERKVSEFTYLTQQLFAASEGLPITISNEDFEVATPETQATLLSAYLRAVGIHLSSILQIPEEKELYLLLFDYQKEKSLSKDFSDASISLETSVVSSQKAIFPNKKMEDNFPKIVLSLTNGKRSQILSLAYDRTGTGLKWAALDGEYLLRFQPNFREIPYRIRLRQARQINYANSSQPYSFESDLIITDRHKNTDIEKTISMNNVHETWDGYRFYLSSVTPPNETTTKQVQVVVNYDPAKYWLTYPGAIVLSCGILMLFMMRPYRRSKH